MRRNLPAVRTINQEEAGVNRSQGIWIQVQPPPRPHCLVSDKPLGPSELQVHVYLQGLLAVSQTQLLRLHPSCDREAEKGRFLVSAVGTWAPQTTLCTQICPETQCRVGRGSGKADRRHGHLTPSRRGIPSCCLHMTLCNISIHLFSTLFSQHCYHQFPGELLCPQGLKPSQAHSLC